MSRCHRRTRIKGWSFVLALFVLASLSPVILPVALFLGICWLALRIVHLAHHNR